MEVGIQSNLWPAEYHREKMPQMIREIAAAGYAGIEIGVHRFADRDHPEDFLQLVESDGLHVAGIHMLCSFFYQEALKGSYDYPRQAVAFARGVRSAFLLVSGDPGDHVPYTDYTRLSEVLNQAGQICHAAGIICCYHNHWWELANGQEGLDAICSLTSPSLVSLCIDVGWVERAGLSPADVVRRYLDRTSYLHLKDTRDNKWIELGYGTVDVKGVLEVVANREDIYLTVEREEPLPNALQSAQLSRAYLRRLGI